MPRDWKADPLVIDRHCQCHRLPPIDGHEPETDGEGLAIRESWLCPLHSPDPRFDLPPECP